MITDPLGNTMTYFFGYDPASDKPRLEQTTGDWPTCGLGTTNFGYDALNRQTSATDVNGVVTETQYDALDRVTMVTQRGATVAENLVTEYRFDAFGGLFQIILPEGNVIEYSYDSAGRLTTIERKPDDQPASHGERIVYTLNGASKRIREEQETWDGATWVKRSQTETIYSTRCQADKIIRGFGGEEITTEFTYDCDGNLERVWDANHPSAGQTTLATSEYSYDDLGRVEEIQRPFGGAGGGTVVTGYLYDVQNHLRQVSDAEGAVSTYEYSDRDLLTEEISEVSGTTTRTYDEHGGLATTTDARGITEARTIDALDRVTFIDSSDDSLDIVNVYDAPGVPFSLGRLTSIERADHSVNTTYDRFGRVLQDGNLVYGYDKNSNRTEVQYPDGVLAEYTYDYADRQATLAVARPGEADQILVTAAAYEPSGPLASLTLGNGLVETRGFDTRYYPASIVVDSGEMPVFDWQYTTDPVGNITSILDGIDAANHRAYAYQDFQYFLTQGDGPWGDLSWTYDKAGNRLSETRDGVVDTYSYVLNGAGGNSAQLQQIQFGAGGTKTYSHDLAGNQNQIDNGGDITDRTYDDAGRLAQQERASAQATTDFSYDGRSFLRRTVSRVPVAAGTGVFCDGFESGDTSAWMDGGTGGTCFAESVSEPIYSSQAHLLGIDSGETTHYVFYFGDRPVAQLNGSSGTFSYVTTDHLSTPVQAADSFGATIWTGGFEPFGIDYSGAGDAGIFLRFPGQWQDGSWAESSGDTTYNNVRRWYGPGTGRYTRPDPINLGVLGSASRPQEFPLGALGSYHLAMLRTGNPQHEQAYLYSAQNPLLFSDPLGLFGPGALATAGGACVAGDGPLPIGDLVGVPLLIGATVWAAGIVATDWWNNADACSDCESDESDESDEPDEPDECDLQYAADSVVCRTLSTSRLRELCWKKAAVRYGECIVGKRPRELFPLE